MLEGPWGAGKTYFIRNYFQERSNDSSEYLYASLFGVKSADDINSQFFAQIYPALSGKKVRAMTGFLLRTVNIAGRVVSGSDAVIKSDSESIRDMLIRLENKILVFDDLERCPMPLTEVMGIINNYVEHDKLKVILIAAEDEIPEGHQREYERRKEKLIGKTIRVISDPSHVLRKFAGQLTSDAAKKTIERAEAVILDIIGNKPNFRSLRATLQDFDRLVKLADPKLSQNPLAIERVALYLVATGIEIRRGNISASFLVKLPKLVGLSLFPRGAEKELTEDEAKALYLRDKYQSVAWSDPVVPPAALADLFATGSFDVEGTNLFIAAHLLIAGPEQTPAWRRLWSFSDAPRSDYDAARAELLEQLHARKLTHPGEILHAVGVTLRLRGLGDDILNGIKPSAFFDEYLTDLAKLGTLQPAPELFDRFSSDGHQGLIYNYHDNISFRKICARVKVVSDRALAARLKIEAPALIQTLKDNPEKHKILYECGRLEGNYGDSAILHYIDVEDFADILIVNDRPTQLMAALYRRYDQALPSDSPLKLEFTWLRNLVRKLRIRARHTRPPYRKIISDRIDYYFGNRMKVLSSAPKKKPGRGKKAPAGL